MKKSDIQIFKILDEIENNSYLELINKYKKNCKKYEQSESDNFKNHHFVLESGLFGPTKNLTIMLRNHDFYGIGLHCNNDSELRKTLLEIEQNPSCYSLIARRAGIDYYLIEFSGYCLSFERNVQIKNDAIIILRPIGIIADLLTGE